MFAWPEFIEDRSIGCPITPLKALNVRVNGKFLPSTATYNIVLLYEERIKLDLKD